jgi:hypothetical protein
MIIAKQSTAIIVTVGPVLDADGAFVSGGVVGDFKISKNGGAPAALNGSATLTHRATGHYSLSLTTSDVDTVGTAEIIIDDTVNGCPMKEIQVVEGVIYDAVYADSATGLLPANVTQISGDSTAADNLELAFDDTAGAVPWSGIVDQGTAQSVGANDIVLRSAAAFVDDALIGCTVYITNGTQLGSRSVITDYVGATDTATLGNGWTGATPTGTPTYKIFASAAGSGVAQTGDAYAIVNSGTYGNAALKTLIDAVDDYVDAEVSAIKTVTDQLADTLEDQGGGVYGFTEAALELAPSGTGASAASIADAVWDEAQADHVTVGSFGIVASEIADILVDTAEIGAAGAGLTNINLPNQTMDIVGSITGNLSGSVGSVTGAVGSVTGLTAADVGAIKAKTDNLPSDPADASVVAGLIAAVDAKVDIIDTNIDDIETLLGLTDTDVAAILALLDDARGEPAQGAPPVNPDLATKVDWLYKLMRNKITQTATTLSIYNDAGNVVDHKSTVSDDATTYTRGEIVSGP